MRGARLRVLALVLACNDLKPPSMAFRFYPSEVKRISNEVLEKHLTGKEYDEDLSKEQAVAICDEIKNRVKGEVQTSSP